MILSKPLSLNDYLASLGLRAIFSLRFYLKEDRVYCDIAVVRTKFNEVTQVMEDVHGVVRQVEIVNEGEHKKDEKEWRYGRLDYDNVYLLRILE